MRNRRKPGDVDGEILPPVPVTQRGDVSPYRQPLTPALREFDGVVNVVAHLRAWGQSKGYKALTRTLDNYDVALRAQLRVGEAIEALELQEERLHPQNLEILKEAERRDIDTTLATATGRLHDAETRNRQSQIRSQISEEELQRDLILARRQREEEEGVSKDEVEPVPESEEEKSIQEQLAEFTEPLLAAQEKLNAGIEDGSLTEAGEIALEKEISIYLTKLEALSTKYTTDG